MKLDSIDKQLLIILQTSFPSTASPYADIAKQLQIPTQECLIRIQHLCDNHIIRRIGGILQSDQLGYRSTLCAAKVPMEDIPRVAAILNQSSSITHNYQRDHEFSLWFTFIEKEELFDQELQTISSNIGYNVISFPTTKKIKSKVQFNVL
jgi:DNA-binding Lrp family transcriptional regulator